MKQPTTQAPFVVVGADGKEYGANDRETLGQWWSQGAINESNRIWSSADQKWMNLKELSVRKMRRVLVTTGDINREYQVIDVVFGFVGKDTPAFGRVDIPAAYSEVTDQLANAAASLGANAVVWTRYGHEWQGVGGGVGVFASGTAVVFTAREDHHGESRITRSV